MKLELKIKNKKIFAPLKNKWLVLTPEEKVRQTYICRLVNYYGYSLDQIQQDVVSQSEKFMDIVIYRNRNFDKPLILVECKSHQIIIRQEDFFKGSNYAQNIGIPFFVTVNQKETRVFTKFFSINHKNEDASQITEILNIPNKNESIKPREIDKLLAQTVEFARTDFSRILLKCHNIIRNNDKLSPEASFDEISKILFIKTLYERSNEKGLIYSLSEYKEEKKHYEKIKNKEDLPFYQKRFVNVKSELEDDQLFEKNELVKIKEVSFEAIIKELEKYNLSTTSDDIKGIAFEEFLGKTFRGELGQFFTPRTVVDYMVEILDPQEGETICDPCCGSGGFLIKAFEFVRNKIEKDIKEVKEKIKLKYYTDDYYNASKREQKFIDQKVNEHFTLLNSELDIANPEGRSRKLSFECIYGTDANPRMARTAKMNMIMHGDGHGGVHHHDGLLNVNGIFDGRFDIILTNPPFGARVEKTLRVSKSDLPSEEKIEKFREKYGVDYIENVIKPMISWAEFDNGKNKPKGKPILNLFDTGKISSLTEVLFIERCIDLLKPGGRMGIVLPEGVLNNPKLKKIRDYVEGKAKIVNITSIPQDVFIASGATVKPSLLFFKKFTEEEAKEHASILETATKNARNEHGKEIAELQKKIKIRGINKEKKKELREKLKQVEQQMADEIKLDLKTNFDYEIPIVEVKKAGISTTGAKIENELEPVAKEFTKYRIEKRLWNEHCTTVRYDEYDDKFKRVVAFGEPETFYTKYANIN